MSFKATVRNGEVFCSKKEMTIINPEIGWNVSKNWRLSGRRKDL